MDILNKADDVEEIKSLTFQIDKSSFTQKIIDSEKKING